MTAEAPGAITYAITGSNWPADRLAATQSAMAAAVARFNAYASFDKVITVTYNAGVATADANYNGSLRVGPSIPVTERVMMHEIAHTLGVGTISNYAAKVSGGQWTGTKGLALIRQFDGVPSTLNTDGTHFWPYGLNFDNEGSEINKARSVAMVYAMRIDMGIGATAAPSNATTVSLTVSDPLGTSGFNYSTGWSDGHFAHAGADYFTGNFAVRTPTGPNSFEFAGKSLTLNNTATTNGGLFYKGSGTTGVQTFKNLILDGGTIHHYGGAGDLFQLDGKVTVASASTISSEQGSTNILADLTGDAPLTIGDTGITQADNGFVRLMSSDNTFTGGLNVIGRFELSNGANFQFLIEDGGISNAITGSTAKRVLLNGLFELDLTGAAAQPGDLWSLVTSANTTYGNTFGIAGFTQTLDGVWTNGGYVFAEATGRLSFVPEPASLAVAGLLGLGLVCRRRGCKG